VVVVALAMAMAMVMGGFGLADDHEATVASRQHLDPKRALRFSVVITERTGPWKPRPLAM
jgi:hypothetical protein